LGGNRIKKGCGEQVKTGTNYATLPKKGCEWRKLGAAGSGWGKRRWGFGRGSSAKRRDKGANPKLKGGGFRGQSPNGKRKRPDKKIMEEGKMAMNGVGSSASWANNFGKGHRKCREFDNGDVGRKDKGDEFLSKGNGASILGWKNKPRLKGFRTEKKFTRGRESQKTLQKKGPTTVQRGDRNLGQNGRGIFRWNWENKTDGRKSHFEGFGGGKKS